MASLQDEGEEMCGNLEQEIEIEKQIIKHDRTIRLAKVESFYLSLEIEKFNQKAADLQSRIDALTDRIKKSEDALIELKALRK